MAKEYERPLGQRPTRFLFLRDGNIWSADARAKIEPDIDLHQRTWELLKLVREPTPSEQSALEREKFVFLHISTISLGEIVQRDPYYFWGDYDIFKDREVGQLAYLNGRPWLRDYTPQSIVIAVNPNFILPTPEYYTPKRQLRVCEKFSQEEIEPVFPDAKAVILPAAALVQADMEYRKKKGRPLFEVSYDYSACYVRALDQSPGGIAIKVGRDYHGMNGHALSISTGNIIIGPYSVDVLPAIIFISGKAPRNVEDARVLLKPSDWTKKPARSRFDLILEPRKSTEGLKDLSFFASCRFDLGDYCLFEGYFDLGKGPQEYQLGISQREESEPMWFVRSFSKKSVSAEEKELGRKLARKLVHTLPTIEDFGGKWFESQWLKKVWDDPRTKFFDVPQI